MGEMTNFKFYFTLAGISNAVVSDERLQVQVPFALELLIPAPSANPPVECTIQSTLVNVSEQGFIGTPDKRGNCVTEQTISDVGLWNIMATLTYANRIVTKTLVIKGKHFGKGNNHCLSLQMSLI